MENVQLVHGCGLLGFYCIGVLKKSYNVAVNWISELLLLI